MPTTTPENASDLYKSQITEIALPSPVDKTAAKALIPEDGVKIYPQGSDGGVFIGGTGKAVGYYDDNGGIYYGTRFKPTGGDGSAGWERPYKGPVADEWFGIVADNTVINTTRLQQMFNTFSSYTLTSGNIRTDAPVTIRNYALIQGLGQAVEDVAPTADTETTRIVGQGVNAIIDNLVSPLSDNRTGKMKLRDFTVTGDFTGTVANAYCLYFRGSQRISLDHITAAWSTEASVYIAAGVANEINNCQVRYSEKIGLHLDLAADGLAVSYNAYMTNIMGGTYSQNANANIQLDSSTVNVNLRGVDIESAGSFYPAGDGFGLYMNLEANSVTVDGCWFEDNKIHLVIGDNASASPSTNTIPRNIHVVNNEFWSYRGTCDIKINSGKEVVIENNRFLGSNKKIIVGHYADTPVVRHNIGQIDVEDGNGNLVIIDNKSKVNNFPYSIMSAWALVNCTVTQSFEISPAGMVPVYKITPTAPGAVQLQSINAVYTWLQTRQSISCYVKTDAAAPIDFYLAISSVGVPRVYTNNTNDISSIGTDWSMHRIGRSVDSADVGNQAFTIQFTAATTDPIYITGMVSIDGLVYDDYKAPDDLSGTFNNTGTPSAYGLRYALTGGTTAITDITDGQLYQTLTIISEHAITITDNTNLILAGSVNFVMKATDTLTLTMKSDGNWYELSRSVN